MLQVEIQKKAQLTVLCHDLKLMSRHELVLIAHDQSRPLSFKLQLVCLTTTLISGGDIVCGQCSFSVDVATSVTCRDIIVFLFF